MKTAEHIEVLKKIVNSLEGSDVVWALTGSMNFALQGIPVEVHDIDLQTDSAGAYVIEKVFSNFVRQHVYERHSETIISHYGKLLIDDVEVEIMGGLRKKLTDGSWEKTGGC